MSLQRCAALVGAVALSFAGGCAGNGDGGPTSPSGGGSAPATLALDDGVRFSGSHPAPLVVGGVTYVYQNTAVNGTTVQASVNGLAFAPTAASFPAGVSRSIVSLPDGRFRMYYFADGSSVDVRSAVSNNGLNWSAENGIRYSDPGMGALRATVVPPAGYRLYYPFIAGIHSATSIDGLTFVNEGPAIPPPNDMSTWGASAAVYLSGEFHMVLTKVPASGISELWHAVSRDGRNWTIDSSALAVNPGIPLDQPAWSIDGNTARIYFRAQPPGGSNAIASGIIRF